MPLTNFTDYAKGTTEHIANNARKLVSDAAPGDLVNTRNRVQQKDDLAKDIAQRDGITEGIICLISAVEPCMSFQVRRRHETKRIELLPPGAQVPAPLPLPHRLRVRLHARAHPGLDSL